MLYAQSSSANLWCFILVSAVIPQASVTMEPSWAMMIWFQTPRTGHLASLLMNSGAEFIMYQHPTVFLLAAMNWNIRSMHPGQPGFNQTPRTGHPASLLMNSGAELIMYQHPTVFLLAAMNWNIRSMHPGVDLLNFCQHLLDTGPCLGQPGFKHIDVARC